jgi:hypothetical protein
MAVGDLVNLNGKDAICLSSNENQDPRPYILEFAVEQSRRECPLKSQLPQLTSG